MATLIVRLTLETAEFAEALALLEAVHSRLARRHGDAFRRLDRAIETFLDDPQGCVKVHDLGGGRMMAAADGRLTEILRDARALGVIG